MPDTIRDGSGKGYLAKVDSSQRVYTKATTSTEFSANSDSVQRAYTIYGELTFVAADTDEGILFITYNGTGNEHFHVSHIVFSGVSDITATPNGSTTIELYVDSTYTSGGAAVTPINMNRRSGNVLQATCYTGVAGTPIVATAGTKEVLDVKGITGSMVVDMDGALILGQSNTMYILGKASNIGDKVRATVFGFVEDHA